jgi:hypothetical protein
METDKAMIMCSCGYETYSFEDWIDHACQDGRDWSKHGIVPVAWQEQKKEQLKKEKEREGRR